MLMTLEQRVTVAKKNPYEMNNLISEYKPFIASVVQKQVKRFVQYGRDDELSIGLIAFEESVKSYNNDKGFFLSFAENVIKRRLIDYYRKEVRNSNIIPLSTFYDENEEKNIDITSSQSIEVFSQQQESEYRKYEILEIQEELKEFGISFFDLPKDTPKHEETKKIYKIIVNTVLYNKELLDRLKLKKYFPIAEIADITGIHRKKIERARRYVIVLIIILTGDYKYVQSFIDWR